MPKVAKFFLRGCGVLLEILVITLILLAFFIRSSNFQTYLAHKAASYYSKEWKTQVQLQRVDIDFFNRIYVEGVRLLDRKQRTLLKVSSLEVKILDFGMEHLTLEEIVVSNGKVWVCAEKPNGVMNFAFISDYFASSDTSSSSSPFSLELRRITFKNTALRYDDFRVAESEFGLDPNHLEIKGLNLEMSKLGLDGPKITFAIDHFSFRDRSGLTIKELTASFSMDATSLRLSHVNLLFNGSSLHVNTLGYSLDQQSDRNDFLNKAKISCLIASSTVDMRDIALLVPELRGMNEKLTIKGELYNVPNRLKIRDLEVGIRKHTRIKANLELPDFRDWTAFNVREQIVEACIDVTELNEVKLPGGKPLNLGNQVLSLGTIAWKNLNLTTSDGTLRLDPVEVSTSLGTVTVNAPVKLTPGNKGIDIENLEVAKDLLLINALNLGPLTELTDLGVIDGALTLTSISTTKDGIQLTGGKGRINSLMYGGYTYQNIGIQRAELTEQMANIHLEVQDPNLALTMDVNASISGKAEAQATIDLQKSHLLPLGFAQKSTNVEGNIELSIRGTSFKEFSGRVLGHQLKYAEGLKEIEINQLTVDLDHAPANDRLKLRSTLADLDFEGKIDPKTIQDDILYICSRPVPSWFNANKPSSKEINNRLDATLVVHESSQVTELFVPELTISNGTKVVVKFDSDKEQLGLDITANQLMYDSIVLNKVRLTQGVFQDSVIANLVIADLALSDSLKLYDLNFFSNGSEGILRSSLGWDAGKLNESKVNWKTSVLSNGNYDLLFDESRFSLNGYRWNLKKGSDFQVNGSTYWSNNFTLLSQKNKQEIRVNGKLSNLKQDVMKVFLTNVNLTDLSDMLGLGIDMSGSLGGELGIADPFRDLTLTSQLKLHDFRFNQQEIGTISLNASYDDTLAAVIINGDLLYRDKNTLLFNGAYKVKEKDNNLQLALTFDNTDLGFVNGFMDPTVVDKVSGKVRGAVDVSGSVDNPVLKGSLFLDNAAADFTLLGCRYTINGKIQVEKAGFYVNKAISIKDADGNNASLDIAVFHDNFTNFNYNVDIDFDKGFQASKNPQKIEKFMVLNTSYKPGDSYYGKAYALGFAHIEGEGSSMSVDVDLTTRKGSKIIFPMYGSSELEDESIIHFVSRGKEEVIAQQKINYSGIDIKIGFNITSDADIRLVFNEQTQDEIRAKTNGRLNLSLDAFNQMKLNGTLGILPGSIYNFTMGPARKPFDILEGTIVWKGDVEHADMNVVTSYMVKHANMLELMPGQNNEALARQNTQCLLRLYGDLMAPAISFQLEAPQAPEAGKALLNRINSDVDELNRQFFSLMLFNKFQPLQGGVSANESAALDLVESQINSALAQMSKSYEVKMDIGSSNISTTVQKSFLNNRLTVSGSFGVDNSNASSVNGGLIGDVSIEYLINEQGTFRVNAFNRSNGNTVKENAGPFTQGAGFSYHEDFDSRKDFILMQSFLDVFRKKPNRVVQYSRKRQKTKVPSLVPETPEKQEENE